MRILIAEDDTIIADGLSRSLRQGGYAVDWAPNGMDADTALLTGSYDLLIQRNPFNSKKTNPNQHRFLFYKIL